MTYLLAAEAGSETGGGTTTTPSLWTFSATVGSGPSGRRLAIPPGFQEWFTDDFNYASTTEMLAATFNGSQIYSSLYGPGAPGSHQATAWWDQSHVTIENSQLVITGSWDSTVGRYVTGGFATGKIAAAGNLPPNGMWVWCIREETATGVSAVALTYGNLWPTAGSFAKWTKGASPSYSCTNVGNNTAEWPYCGEDDVIEGGMGSQTSFSTLHHHDPALAACTTGSSSSQNYNGHRATTLVSSLAIDRTKWQIAGTRCDPATSSAGPTIRHFTNDGATTDLDLREFAARDMTGVPGATEAFEQGGRRLIVQSEATTTTQSSLPSGPTKLYVDWIAYLVPVGSGSGWSGGKLPNDLLNLSTWKLTEPRDSSDATTGTAVEILHPAIETREDAWFHSNIGETGVVFTADAGGAKTGSSDYARSELREMAPPDGTAEAAWASNDTQTHTLTSTLSIDALPIARPIVVCAQAHGAGSESVLLIQADGFRPTTGTIAARGPSTTIPFTITYKLNSGGSQVELAPILTNVSLGEKFTVRIEVAGGVAKIYADKGATATTLQATTTHALPATGMYFKTGCYLQSSTDNSGKTVPTVTCAGGADLTTPPAGSTVPNEASDVTGVVTVYATDVTHVAAGGGPTLTVPADDLDLLNWKVTLPVTSTGALGNGSSPREVTQPALATFALSPYFAVSGSAIAFRAPCDGATTSGSSYPRSELREMTTQGTATASWSTTSGVHVMTITQSVDELPVAKPQVVCGQIHDANDDIIEILADGFSPTSGTVATTGTSATPFTIGYRFMGTQDKVTPLLTGYVLGQVFTVKIEAGGGTIKLSANLGATATTLKKTISASKTGCYFKAGAYTQSNSTNTGKTVPAGTCAGGADLTSPVAGAATGGDSSSAGGKVTISRLAVTHSDTARSIGWSRYPWLVRPPIASQGPGPNAWSDSADSAEVIGGVLNLRLYQASGVWQCVELVGPHLGYGQYTWVMNTDPTNWDIKPVLGLFTYDDSDDGSHAYREIDIEFSLWNYAAEPSRAWYSNQPTVVGSATIEPRLSDHGVDAAVPYTCTFIWQPGQVYWRTTDANGKLLGEHVCTDAVQAPGAETVRMNLWLQNGTPPVNGQPLTVQLQSFAFTPSVTHALVAAASTAIGFTDGTPGSLTLKAGASIVSNRLQLACAATDYSLAYTGSVFNLSGSSVDTRIDQIPGLGNGTTEALFELRWDASNWFSMFVSGGGFYARLRQAGVNTTGTLPSYNANTHRYWRIREAAGTVYFDTSPDRSTWTNRYSAAHTLGAKIQALRVRYECGYFGAETSPGPLVVGAINGGAPQLSEDWAGLTGTGWTDGSTHGQWNVVFNGGGTVGIETDGGNVLGETPAVATTSGVTHSSLVVSTASFGDMDMTVDMKTVAQVRTGSAPNAWERAWILWHYTDNTHFYSLVLKANGWELGKEDPAYSGSQRFLASNSTPTWAVGGWNTVRITQVGAVITVYVDGVILTTFTDTERPYLTGNVGLYNEDSHVHFGRVTVL